MKDGEPSDLAVKSAFRCARAGAVAGLLVTAGLLALPLDAAVNGQTTGAGIAPPVVDRNFHTVVATDDGDTLEGASRGAIVVAQNAPDEPQSAGAPAANADDTQGQRQDLGLVDRIQYWFARANRKFQTVIIRRLSVGGEADSDAREVQKIKEDDAEAARDRAEEAIKAAQAKRQQEIEAEAREQARLAEEKQRQAAEKKAGEEAAARAQAERERAEADAQAEKDAQAAKAAAEQRKRGDEAHQRALADAAEKATEDAKRVAAEQEAARVAAAKEAQEKAAREAAEKQRLAEAAAKARAAKDAEERARQETAARAEAERQRVADEQAARTAAENQRLAEAAKAAEEKAKQDAAQKEAAASEKVEEKAKPPLASPPVEHTEPPVHSRRHEAMLIHRSRHTHLAQGPVVKRWVHRARQGRCTYAGRKILLPGRYVVARGDTLWRIALRHYRSGLYFMRIYRANRDLLHNPNLIYPCQRLYLPRKHG